MYIFEGILPARNKVCCYTQILLHQTKLSCFQYSIYLNETHPCHIIDRTDIIECQLASHPKLWKEAA